MYFSAFSLMAALVNLGKWPPGLDEPASAKHSPAGNVQFNGRVQQQANAPTIFGHKAKPAAMEALGLFSSSEAPETFTSPDVETGP